MPNWQLKQTSQAPVVLWFNLRSAPHEGIHVWFCSPGQQPMLQEVIYLSWEFSTVVNKTDTAPDYLLKSILRITEKLLSVITRKSPLSWVVVKKVSVPQKLRVSVRPCPKTGCYCWWWSKLLPDFRLDPLLALPSLWPIPTKVRAFVYFKALCLPVPVRPPQFILDMVLYTSLPEWQHLRALSSGKQGQVQLSSVWSYRASGGWCTYLQPTCF